MIQVEKAI